MFVASTSEDLFFFSLLVQRKEPTRFQTEYLGQTRWNRGVRAEGQFLKRNMAEFIDF